MRTRFSFDNRNLAIPYHALQVVSTIIDQQRDEFDQADIFCLLENIDEISGQLTAAREHINNKDIPKSFGYRFFIFYKEVDMVQQRQDVSDGPYYDVTVYEDCLILTDVKEND